MVFELTLLNTLQELKICKHLSSVKLKKKNLTKVTQNKNAEDRVAEINDDHLKVNYKQLAFTDLLYVQFMKCMIRAWRLGCSIPNTEMEF